MKLSCVFAPLMDTPDDIAIAERLGFERAWIFDTPHQSPDVFMTLGRAAERTDRIGLGPGVLVPSLRHPMVAAAATATLATLAPGRVAIAFGTGFTGRRAMGHKALTWDFVSRYIVAYRGLIKGEVVDWEGAKMKMFAAADDLAHAASDVPILLSALGPKGEAIARSLELDGLMSFGAAVPGMVDFDWSVLQVGGTVVDDNEELDSEHVRSAAGAAWAINYHAAHDFQGGLEAVRTMPGGNAWADVIQKTPEDDRHFSIHDGHLMYLNEADQAAWGQGGSSIITDVTFTGDPGRLRALVDDYAGQGVTELAVMTSGPDIPRELERYINALA
jgi:5,10-methylenetetrahydromethanopterin reductase